MPRSFPPAAIVHGLMDENVDASRQPTLSVITAAFNEEQNLPVLYEALRAALDGAGVEWEWLVIDDHSRDRTFEIVGELSARDPRVRGFRFSRNSGSHLAFTCGMEHCAGRAAVIIAADLQDPPETIPELLEKWREGAQVVWAVRAKREGETATRVGTANLFYFIMRHVVGMKELPPSGVDFFLLDRTVIDAVARFRESNISMMALLTWMGFRQAQIHYTKRARLHGTSGWTLRKKLKLAVDSVTAFSYVPIRVMSYAGAVTAAGGFAYAAFIIFHALRSTPVEGWSSLMVVVLLVGGVQMLMLGVLGEYLWRALDEARRRPRYLVENLTANARLRPGAGSAEGLTPIAPPAAAATGRA